MPRQARLDIPGTLHHVIIRGIERRRIVDDSIDQNRFVLRLGELAIETGTAIYAWSLMTNHAHVLLRSGSEGLSHFMRRFLPDIQSRIIAVTIAMAIFFKTDTSQ